MAVPSLRDLQRAFWDAVTGPPGATAHSPLCRVVAASAALAPAERLDVYAEMFFGRILDVLREDYAHTAARLGPEAFEGMVRAYLARHPSAHPSIRHVGAAFPAFLAGSSAPPVADLARLEQARLDVFDAPDAPVLRRAELEAMPAEDWPALPLAPIPALVVVVSDWPVHRLWDDPADRTLAPAWTALRVWRQEFAVYHAPMAPAEEAALGRLRPGVTFGALCEEIDDPAAAAALLLRWIEDGILARTR